MAYYSIYKSTIKSTYVINTGLATLSYRVFALTTTGELILVSDSKIVSPNSLTNHGFTRDGVYVFEVTEVDKTYLHVAIVYDNTRECIARKIEDLLCCCKDNCEADDHYDFNALIAMSNGFLGLIIDIGENYAACAQDDLVVDTYYEVYFGDEQANFSTSGGPGLGEVVTGIMWKATSTTVDAWYTAVLTRITGTMLEDLVVYAKGIEMAINYCSDCQTNCGC